ncbi:putative secretory component protein SHR3 [Xylogone sp. PMI_703]|nr:putative secretory component protein SHR3 [Xylogone sp. PMI_703]
MDPSKVSIFKTYDRPKGQGVSSFATFMIIGPTCFFLGMLFSSFPYDYPLLWTSAATPFEYYAQLEEHLKFLHASPPVIPRILHIIIGVGFLGLFIKLFKPTEANLLFDGASLVLYLVGVVVYITNIVKGLRMVTAGTYGDPSDAAPGEVVIGREDSLRVLAASNTILALVLVGVLVLQAGQWYAERKEQDEAAEFEKEEKERNATKKEKNGGHMTRSAAKKKQ